MNVFFETDSEYRLPTSAQKQFLQFLVHNFNNIQYAIASELPAEVKMTGIDNVSVLQEQFDLDTLGIPLNVDNSPKWDLSLINRNDRSVSLLSNFENLTLVKILVEKASRRPFLLNLLNKISARK